MTRPKPRVLLVDDDDMSRESLRRALTIQGISDVEWVEAATYEHALMRLSEETPHVAIVDVFLNSAEPNGLLVLDEIRARHGLTRVILLTGARDNSVGVSGLRRGAASFIQKPIDPAHLAALVRDGVAQADLRREYQELATVQEDAWGRLLIGRSKLVEEARDAARFAAMADAPLLLVGETGVGKSMLAQGIHRLGRRHGGRLVSYCPGGQSADIVASDLFGHVKGAFTGAAEARTGLIASAQKGTLFLDEIDEFPSSVQVMLLGPLQERRFRPVGSDQEREVDVRIIAATNRPLEELREGTKLRRDLYHRLAHMTLRIPSLRERREDIPLLCDVILEQQSLQRGHTRPEVTPDAMEALTSYSWPGNVRELAAALEAATLRGQIEGRTAINAKDLRLASNDTGSHSASEARQEGGTLAEQLDRFKRDIIEQAWHRLGGNVSHVARELGVDRETVRRYLPKS